MRRPNLTDCLALVFAVVSGAVGAEHVGAAGYWNMPGTFAQHTGHGFGAGYHAPWLLGPVRWDGWGLGTPTRLPCAPVPYYGCASCGDCGQMVEAPSSMESFVPTAAPAPIPAAAPMPTPAPAAPAETRAVEPAPAPVAVTPAETGSLEPQPIAEPVAETAAEPVRPLFDAPVQP